MVYGLNARGTCQLKMHDYDKEYPQHRQPENADDEKQNSKPLSHPKQRRAVQRKKAPVPPNLKNSDFYDENRGGYYSLRHPFHLYYSSKYFWQVLLVFLCFFLLCFLVAKWKAETAPATPRPNERTLQNH